MACVCKAEPTGGGVWTEVCVRRETAVLFHVAL